MILSRLSVICIDFATVVSVVISIQLGVVVISIQIVVERIIFGFGDQRFVLISVHMGLALSSLICSALSRPILKFKLDFLFGQI